MNAEERLAYNMDYLNLTKRQCEIHDIIMLSTIDTWPPSLHDFLQKVSEKYGICGAVISETVASWIAEREEEF